jgi:hypothetical protein
MMMANEPTLDAGYIDPRWMMDKDGIDLGAPEGAPDDVLDALMLEYVEGGANG